MIKPLFSEKTHSTEKWDFWGSSKKTRDLFGDFEKNPKARERYTKSDPKK